MKLFEIAISDPSDFRSGDQYDQRSPYYSGPEESYEDPMEKILAPFSKGRDSIVLNAECVKDTGDSVRWIIDVTSPEAAQAVVSSLTQQYDLGNMKTAISKKNAGNGDPEDDYVELDISYRYSK